MRLCILKEIRRHMSDRWQIRPTGFSGRAQISDFSAVSPPIFASRGNSGTERSALLCISRFGGIAVVTAAGHSSPPPLW